MTTLSANFRRVSVVIALVAIVSFGVSATGCKSAQKKEDDQSTSGASDIDNTMGDSDSGKAMGLQTV